MVMDDDVRIRDKRLQLMAGLRDLVAAIADISEIVPSDVSSALPNPSNHGGQGGRGRHSAQGGHGEEGGSILKK
jgi:hypothetical protein